MENFIIKILNKFKNFIKNIKNKKLMLNETNNLNSNNVVKNDIVEELKIRNEKNKVKESIVNIIEKNPESLKKLNSNQLKIISEYYDDKIEEAKRVNSNLKEQINRINKMIENLEMKLQKIN